jgi:hypothetical protein
MIAPVVVYAAVAALAAVIWLGVLDKLRRFADFRAAVEAYRLLPGGLTGVFAALFVCIEVAAGALLLFAAGRIAGAVLAILAVGVASAAVAVNLLRGYTDIDCGCGGLSRFSPGLSWWMVVRNIGLLLLAFVVVLGADRPAASMMWLDRITLAGLAIALVGFYYLANQLIDLHLRARKLRSQT